MYYLTGIAGITFMIAPWIFSYTDNPAALWTSFILGFVVLGTSLWEGLEKNKEKWEYLIAGIIGLIAVITPFILGFDSTTSAKWATIIMGTLIAVLGFGKLWMGELS